MITVQVALALLSAAAAQVAAPPAENAVPTLAPAGPSPAVVAPVPATLSSIVLLKRDTPVELMATSEISTANVSPGTVFKMRVNHPVEVGGRIIVPIGAWAFGEVVTATASGGLGKSGVMTARLLRLQVGDAEVPLEGDVKEKGTGAGSAGVAVLLTGWVGLFHRGNNAKIKAGEIVTGFVREDVSLDMSGPRARVAASAVQ